MEDKHIEQENRYYWRYDHATDSLFLCNLLTKMIAEQHLSNTNMIELTNF